jgi:SAM-dependent methyltransferase
MQDGGRANPGSVRTTRTAEQDPAQRVRETWDLLAATPWRDFFISSHPGWRDATAVHRQALIDAQNYLDGIDRQWLARQHVLEIGCGVGRIARIVAELGSSYTGIDIAQGMVREARRRCDDLIDARFLLTSGLALPPAALDREYGFVYAAAAFIHCPKDVISSMVRSAWTVIARGGKLRMQLNVDPRDPEGVPAPASSNGVAAPVEHVDSPRGAPPVPPEAYGLLRRLYYVGHAFRVAEARADLAQWTGARVELHRLSVDQLYAELTKD